MSYDVGSCYNEKKRNQVVTATTAPLENANGRKVADFYFGQCIICTKVKKIFLSCRIATLLRHMGTSSIAITVGH